MTGQSPFMLIFVLRKVTLQNRINSVPWMNEVTPATYHAWTHLVQEILWINWMTVTEQSRQTVFIHGTRPTWPSSFMVHGWCDCVKSWYGAGVTSFIHGVELMSFGVQLVWFCTVYTKAVHTGSRMSDPGSKNSNKREAWEKICCPIFFSSHKYQKLKKILFLNRWRKIFEPIYKDL